MDEGIVDVASKNAIAPFAQLPMLHATHARPHPGNNPLGWVILFKQRECTQRDVQHLDHAHISQFHFYKKTSGYQPFPYKENPVNEYSQAFHQEI